MSDGCPLPHPDELYYSLCARASVRWRFPSRRLWIQTVFGQEFVAASLELPSHLTRGLASLPAGHAYTVDQLIDDHTLLPLYAPFLPPERVQQLRAEMRADGGIRVYGRSGLKASRVPSPACLRYCARCVDDDRHRFGETYWHRTHQVVGVEGCPQHRVALRNACAHVVQRHTAYEYVAAEDVIPYNPDSRAAGDAGPEDATSRQRHPIVVHIAQSVAWLLAQRNLSPGLRALHHRYHQLLTERELTVRGGRIQMREVVQQFTRRVPVEVQRQVYCDLVADSDDHWLARLLRTPRCAQHPLHHLLALFALDVSVAEFFAPYLLLPAPATPSLPQDVAAAPFGPPPWPCLNPASDHYAQPRIWCYDMVPLRSVRGPATPPPRARFACACGFVYIRTGPDRTQQDRLRCDQVQHYGPVWERRLVQWWGMPTMSVRAIARQLRVDPLTVMRHAARAGLSARTNHRVQPLSRALWCDPAQQPTHRLAPGEKAAAPCDGPQASALRGARDVDEPSAVPSTPGTLGTLGRQVECRALWSAAVAARTSEGAKRLRQQMPAVYMWLYRHDRVWLQAHLPPRRVAGPRATGGVDWAARDRLLAQAVDEAAQRLLRREDPPVYLSRSAIARETGQSDVIFQRLEKLPQTAAALARMSESRITFAVRRVRLAAAQFIAEGEVPPRWRLERHAGVGRLATVSVVAQMVTAALAAIVQEC